MKVWPGGICGRPEGAAGALTRTGCGAPVGAGYDGPGRCPTGGIPVLPNDGTCDTSYCQPENVQSRPNRATLTGGRYGIRTHGDPKATTIFETVPFVRSGNLPPMRVPASRHRSDAIFLEHFPFGEHIFVFRPLGNTQDVLLDRNLGGVGPLVITELQTQPPR